MGCISDTAEQTNKIKDSKIKIGQMTILVQQKIAAGAYGDIWKCKDTKTGNLFAAKQINLQSKELKQMYKKEKMWLEKLSNVQGVVKYIGSKLIDDDQKKNDRNRGSNIPIGIIITQFYQISLYDQLRNRNLSVLQILSILKSLLKTLSNIHKLGCIHLDLKLENILVRNSKSGKRRYHICDFGSCIQGPINVLELSKRKKSQLKQYLESNSTLIYRSPEMIELNKTNITQKSDIWMLGCIIYLLLYRKHPFEGQGQLGILTAQVDFNRAPQALDHQKNKHQTDLIIQSIKGMLKLNPEERQSQSDLIQILSN